MNALILLAIVAGLGVAIFSGLNRKAAQRVLAAKKELQKRASALKPHSISEFLRDAGLTEGDHGAYMLLGVIADMLKVELDQLARDYPMHDLLIISFNSDGQSESQIFDPFSYELLEKVISLSDKRLWEQRWRDKPELPRSEDDLLNLIINMTLGEFLRFFSPLMRSGGR